MQEHSESINELISFFFQSVINDSGYGTVKRKAPPPSGKENSPSKKARKALPYSWSTPGEIQVPGFCAEPLTLMPETPVSKLYHIYVPYSEVKKSNGCTIISRILPPPFIEICINVFLLFICYIFI